MSRLRASLGDDTFVKLTLGHPVNEGSPLRKTLVRPVLIRGQARCSVVSRFRTRDETKNFTFPEALALLENQLGTVFLSAHLFTLEGEAQLDDLAGKPRLRITTAPQAPPSLEHDRAPSRWVDVRAPYLTALGVTDAQGKVRERMRDKLRQIERYLDLLDSAVRELHPPSPSPAAPAPLTLCDMGSGKGYLTFATADYFQRAGRQTAEITGVEAREDLVSLCNRVALECHFPALRFVCSPISSFNLPPLDILIALHACDTATDDALAAGLRAGARIILAAPCCHKEARPQVDASSSESPLRDILRHGIFAERHAEMAADALRALLLEQAGYRVRVSEFISPEHTAKNVMLIATRRPGAMPDPLQADLASRIASLKSFYGIRHHRLEQLLLDRR